MSEFVSSSQFVSSSSTNSSESVRQFVTPYIETGSNTNTQAVYEVPKEPASSSSTGQPVNPSTLDQNAAYRAGLCIDCCAVRYSAGRPRCQNCHDTWAATANLPPAPRPATSSDSWADFFNGGGCL